MNYDEKEIECYINKYSKNLKVIDTAKNAYDAISSAKELDDEENLGAVLITLLMVKNNDKTIFDL